MKLKNNFLPCLLLFCLVLVGIIGCKSVQKTTDTSQTTNKMVDEKKNTKNNTAADVSKPPIPSDLPDDIKQAIEQAMMESEKNTANPTSSSIGQTDSLPSPIPPDLPDDIKQAIEQAMMEAEKQADQPMPESASTNEAPITTPLPPDLPDDIKQIIEQATMEANKQMAPVAKKVPYELEKHDHKRIDNYYWMRERENPEVIAHLEAENAYTKAILQHTKGLQDSLYKEIISRIKQTDESVPYKLRGYYYYTRFEEGKEYPIYCRKKGSLEEGKEEIMLNANEMAEGHSFYRVAGRSVSMDNKWLAFAVDTVGRRKYTLHFKNLETGEILAETIPKITGSATWANDNKTVFYTIKQDTTLRSYKIKKHKLGTDASQDVEVFHEEDETYGTYVYKTKSDKYLIVGSYSTLSSEIRFLDANNPDGEFKVLHPREKDLLYSVAHYQDDFYIVTNWEAKNFRLMKTSVTKTEKENWQEIIAHRSDVLLSGLEIFKDYLVLEERKNALLNIRIIKWADKSEHYLDFGEPAYTAYTSINPEFDTPILRYGYTSLTTPSSTFDYDMTTRKKKLLKQQEVLGDFDKNNYQSERLYAKARDGKKVPISLVYHKETKIDGTAPMLLYSYGSYGSSMNAYFTSTRLSLLNRGFVYAIAHIRGGQDLGREWYEDGKLLKKKNTFYDFIDCAKHLVENKYTNSNKLFVEGGSAGGLLIGAVVNMAPELFKGAIADVPFVDVITTMLDETIPLTTSEYDEWGNPNDKEYYEYILSYSPYDNVEAKDYPNMLILTGLHDSQVQYWEPAKWVAKLRELKTDDNMLVFDINMDAGHGGASGRYQRYKESALKYAFILNLLDK